MNVFRAFPRSHLVLAAFVALPLTPFLFANTSPKEPERFTTELALNDVIEAAAATAPAVATVAVETAEALREHREVVRAGDSLARIFERAGIPARELAAVLDAGPVATGLKRIYPGQELVFAVDANDQLARLTYAPSRLESVIFDREGDAFVGNAIKREPQRVSSYREGTIDHSLFVAGQRAGLDDELTMRLAQIFQWDVDFVLDIRKGDSFHVLFEELYVDDELIGFGDILAAEFVNQGSVHRAVRYVTPDGRAEYFGPDGSSMRKAFLRAPLDFRRISSDFNLRRVHPLHKRSMPHRGIDYAAPTGTPVYASGDGRIKIASRNAASGNYVVIQHGEQFQTKYLHLSRFGKGIRGGVRVRQGQLIGYVGATGWATGPHLHYEFLVNGTHKNPRTVDLPKAEPVPVDQRATFQQQTAPLLAILSNQREDVQVAAAR
jgi:murein DD-endopeptidase MepM/ murein hydrolase activator NlpD